MNLLRRAELLTSAWTVLGCMVLLHTALPRGCIPPVVVQQICAVKMSQAHLSSDAQTYARLHACQREQGIGGHVAEVGVYHGRSFIPLALLCCPQVCIRVKYLFCRCLAAAASCWLSNSADRATTPAGSNSDTARVQSTLGVVSMNTGTTFVFMWA